MKKITLKTLFCFIFMLSFMGYAQKYEEGERGPEGYVRCLTTEYNEKLKNQYPNERLSDEEFEEWLAPKIELYKAQRSAGLLDEGEILTIPVVIHIIHDGDPVNTVGNTGSENISYAQAVSQIDVLNEDYRRLAGSPGAGSTGYGLGVDVQVEFCLATQDPNGAASNGVDRVNLCQDSWNMNSIDAVVKPATIWDPTQYMNMWSVKFSDSSLLGYAQFPSASGLQGLNFNGGSADTDGVVSNFNAFGTIAQDDGSFVMNPTYNLGRTMTHEVGHWLGLRHIWGDGGCSQDDYCEDTPDSSTENYSCIEVTHCGSVDMVENYMDYTNDSCMDTFTEDQKARILAVMINSPRRSELVSSNGCQAGISYNLDGEIKLTCFEDVLCNVATIPSIEIVNKGESTITSANISYSVNGGEVETFEWSGSIDSYEIESVVLPSISVINGNNNVTANLVSINGISDEIDINNQAQKEYIYAGSGEIDEYDESIFHLSIIPDNYGSETSWKLQNSNGDVLYQGGPYTNGNNQEITATFELDQSTCYNFTIYDEYGDGICCFYGSGSYEITTEGGTTIVSGGDFDDLESTNFRVGALGLDAKYLEELKIYPNPANKVINISINNRNLPKGCKIFNSLGQVISQKKISNYRDLSIDVSAMSKGIYFMKVEGQAGSKTLKFVKE